MNRSAIFRFRLTPTEAERLDSQADEAGLSKADLIRRALGWDTADRPSREPPPAHPAVVPDRQVDPERQPGLAAIQQIAKRLKEGAP